MVGRKGRGVRKGGGRKEGEGQGRIERTFILMKRISCVGTGGGWFGHV